MTSFCRSFIDNSTELAATLYTLKQKKIVFNWYTNCETAFKKLNMAMTSASIFSYPDTSKSYTMYTDASNVRIRASLHQKQSDNSVRPIEYASKKLLSADRNYCASDKEASAMIYGFSKSHHYIHGTCPRGRIATWNSALQSYDFEIKNLKGLDNGLTVTLIRDFSDEKF
ncbi:Transposon Tf2-9 polyprotein [Smittium mucronatum]|uniref:Transposon Tf2-9 polyprotein n=1 Tax=Smittium mucronatum TaxID=133383 RepID=A0A1R0H037_9FUNG|nr:Transposon Tf2-9 polyprotein [Smittium mucronatum]